MKGRKTKDEIFLEIAKVAAESGSTCLKRRYGAVIAKRGRIISVGWNGAPNGNVPCTNLKHCDRMDAPSNSGDYSSCRSVHAEQSALIYANGEDIRGATLYLWGEEWKDGEWKELKSPTPCPICRRMLQEAETGRTVTANGTEYV